MGEILELNPTNSEKFTAKNAIKKITLKNVNDATNWATSKVTVGPVTIVMMAFILKKNVEKNYKRMKMIRMIRRYRNFFNKYLMNYFLDIY